jgi:hypothetical protein
MPLREEIFSEFQSPRFVGSFMWYLELGIAKLREQCASVMLMADAKWERSERIAEREALDS